MGLIFESTTVEILATVIFLFWMFYQYFAKDYDFWEKREVRHIKPSFPFGNMQDIVLSRVDLGKGYEKFYKEFKGERYVGIIDVHSPVLVVRDPELIKRIMTKDFHHFVDRNIFKLNPNEFIIHHLFNMTGQDWKNMRHKLTPTFTSGKMKMMFLLMEKCSEQLRDHIITQSGDVVDIKSILARFTMDIIATCAFGLEINTLDDEQNEFYRIGSKIFQTSKSRNLMKIMLLMFPFCSKFLFFVPKDIQKFLSKVVSDTVSYREQNHVNRNDFLDLLIKIRQNKNISDEVNGKANGEVEKSTLKKHDEEGISLEQMTAQTFLFFAAGFETASSTMTFCLYELSRNPDVQVKLHEEIQDVLDGQDGKITYQSLQEMTYMEQVINETLRLYASVPVLHRSCTETYKVPDSNLTLEKGAKVIIPTYAIHHDPEYYPDPYRFDPERFSEEEIKKRHQYLHLPFGEGPRMCIGNRFGMMQTKVGLATLISECEVSLTPETQVPITLDPSSFITMPKKPVLLRVTRRQKPSL